MKKNFVTSGLLIFFLITGKILNAQITFPELFEKAKEQSAELVSLEASRNFLELEAAKIKAENAAPKAYLSSEILSGEDALCNGIFQLK